MADDSNKVTITLDLDSKEFDVKIGAIKQGLGGVANEGSAGIEKLGMSFLFVNEALELGKKGLELWEMSIQKMGQTEVWKNQETALKNLTATIGVSSDVVIEAIEKSSKGTVTHTEAVQTAYKLLSSGIRADQIPAIVQWADKLEESGVKGAKFADVINSVSRAVELGSTRGLRDFGIATEKVGERQDVVNTILRQAQLQNEKLGDGYDNTAKRIETRQNEFKEKLTSIWGTITKEVSFAFFADAGMKASQNLQAYEKDLERLQEKEKDGEKFYSSVFFPTVTTIGDARKKLEEEIATRKQKVIDLNKADAASTQEIQEKLTQQKDVELPLTEAQKQRIDVASRLYVLQKQAAQEEVNDGATSIKTAGEVLNAKKLLIDQEFQARKIAISTSVLSAERMKEELIKLEEERLATIRRLQVSDDQFKRAQEDAQLAYVRNNMLTAENSMDQIRNIEIARETAYYQKRQNSLRQQGLEKSQFDKQMESEEVAHQARMSQIKSQYDTINMKNFQFGLNQSLTQMKAQYGSFTNFVSSATQRTHSIVSKAFVDMAKGHGDAMQKMLGQFLEMIGTQMIEMGVFGIGKGIITWDPASVAAGAGLVAAGMALVGASASVSGGGADTGGSVPGPGDAMTLPPQTPGGSGQPDQAGSSAMPQKHAQIVINGDFLNSRETANHLADVLRQNSDITDYAIVAQGRQYGT